MIVGLVGYRRIFQGLEALANCRHSIRTMNTIATGVRSVHFLEIGYSQSQKMPFMTAEHISFTLGHSEPVPPVHLHQFMTVSCPKTITSTQL